MPDVTVVGADQVSVSVDDPSTLSSAEAIALGTELFQAANEATHFLPAGFSVEVVTGLITISVEELTPTYTPAQIDAIIYHLQLAKQEALSG